jgi:hypothetical protein
MTAANGDKPAYPVGIKNNNDYTIVEGMTKREVMAMAAMQGLCAKEGWSERILNEGGNEPLCKQIVTASVHIADELLKALES